MADIFWKRVHDVTATSQPKGRDFYTVGGVTGKGGGTMWWWGVSIVLVCVSQWGGTAQSKGTEDEGLCSAGAGPCDLLRLWRNDMGKTVRSVKHVARSSLTPRDGFLQQYARTDRLLRQDKQRLVFRDLDLQHVRWRVVYVE